MNMSPPDKTDNSISIDDTNVQFNALEKEADAHPALCHVWLKSIAGGVYQDTRHALRMFAVEYRGYSAAFPQYLNAVIDRLEDSAHKDALYHNLEEEKGTLDPEDAQKLAESGINVEKILGVSHPELFKRFCVAIGAGDAAANRPSSIAATWRRRLLEYLESASPAAAVGAIGLGTERIVKPIYKQVLSGLRASNAVSRDDYVFFELHCIVDDQHAKDLETIALELLKSPNGYSEMRKGMLTALSLRVEFWDYLHDMCCTQSGFGLTTEAATA